MDRPKWILVFVIFTIGSSFIQAEGFDRVPRPEFESGYIYPVQENPVPRAPVWEYIDLIVLAGALSLSTWLSLKVRSRVGIAALSFFSIGYFGFFRQGCVCPVGSIQNVAHALFSNSYAIPVTVVILFLLPLLTALFAGRTFCSSVCALGAIQDLVVIKPLKVPRWLSVPLGLFPIVYLGLAILFAATGTEFIICRFDPFVSFYRLAGPFNIVLLGVVFLLAGTLIARPYCRFVCPYGVILGWLSSISVRHATITPDTCIHCGLCNDACPVDAIDSPVEPARKARAHGGEDRRTLSAFIMAVPLILVIAAVSGRLVSPVLAKLNSEVRLAEQIYLEESDTDTPTTLESETFRASTDTVVALYARAAEVNMTFRQGSTITGLFIGLGFCFVFALSYRRNQSPDWQIRSKDCVNCGRCFSYCPREHAMRSRIT